MLRAAGLPEAALSPFWLLGGFLDLGLGDLAAIHGPSRGGRLDHARGNDVLSFRVELGGPCTLGGSVGSLAQKLDGDAPHSRDHCRGRGALMRWMRPSSSNGCTSSAQQYYLEQGSAPPPICGNSSNGKRFGNRRRSSEYGASGLVVHIDVGNRPAADRSRIDLAGGLRSTRALVDRRLCPIRSGGGMLDCSGSAANSRLPTGTRRRASERSVASHVFRIMRAWYALGWPAFLVLILVMWLMVAKPGA